MARKPTPPERSSGQTDPLLAGLACPNPDCCDLNHFGAGNLSVAEWIGKHKHIRRLYCSSCGHRFSERQGTLLQYTKIPEETVVRVVKCLGHGCSLEAAADICDVDPRTVARLLERAGKRAEDFHRLQMDRLPQPLEAVQLDELHGRVCKSPRKKGVRNASRMDDGLLDRVAAWVDTGFMRPWRSRRGL